MPAPKSVTTSLWDLPRILTSLKDLNYLDARIDLRNVPRYLVIRAWRRKPVKRKVGRPRKILQEVNPK